MNKKEKQQKQEQKIKEEETKIKNNNTIKNKIKEFEEYKNKFIQKIDRQINKLYEQRNYMKEIFLNKEELKKRRISVWKKLTQGKIWTTIRHLLSMPFIYMMIIPGIIMHIMIEIYQQICFRLYRIPRVKSKDYFIFDRNKLPHLNWFEKFNCIYCSYYNCLINYMQEIAGRTERFWCPIKHSKRMQNTHKHYDLFSDYSDAENFRENWDKLREFEELKK